MKWISIDMPQASLTDGAYHRLCRQFQKAFIDAGAPADLALFAQRMPRDVNRSATARRLYLSPQSGLYVPELIRNYQGRTCPIPEASSVTLIYGVPGARSLLHGSNSQQNRSLQRTEAPIYTLGHSQEAASAG